MSDDANFGLFKTVFFHCFLILFAPIFTFFTFKTVLFEGVFGTESLASNVWSAVFAIIVLHIALGMFIRRAYFEAGQPDDKADKED